MSEEDQSLRRQVVDAFLRASRDGDFEALLALLHPDVVLRADQATVRAGAEAEIRGAFAVAQTFSGRARHAKPALLVGEPGAIWAPGGRPRIAFAFTIADGKIVGLDLRSDPDYLDGLDFALTP